MARVRVGVGVGLVAPGLQYLQDTGQLQDFQKESQLGPSVDGVEETRGLEPYQGTFGMNASM